jgi:hypothetical protein
MPYADKRVVSAIFLLLIGVVFCLPAWAGSEVRYTKYNIHTQTKDGQTHKASYANYTDPGAGHVIIPAGSEITITKRKRKAFYFTFDGGKKGIFEFHGPRMGMDVNAYIDLISASQPTSQKGLSKLDRQGVKEGKAMPGMTREGVMTALGYPAAHRTPTLDAGTWVYWTNRFGTIAVEFGPDGKVVKVVD